MIATALVAAAALAPAATARELSWWSSYPRYPTHSTWQKKHAPPPPPPSCGDIGDKCCWKRWWGDDGCNGSAVCKNGALWRSCTGFRALLCIAPSTCCVMTSCLQVHPAVACTPQSCWFISLCLHHYRCAYSLRTEGCCARLGTGGSAASISAAHSRPLAPTILPRHCRHGAGECVKHEPKCGYEGQGCCWWGKHGDGCAGDLVCRQEGWWRALSFPCHPDAAV